MTPKRVLLMYISEVSGHHQATLAIEKSLRILDPSVEILNLNGFGYTYPIIEKIVNKAYMGVIKSTPKVWNYLYDNPRVAKRLQKWKEIIHKANHQKLAKLFNEFKPDAVVCSQAFPCGMAADYKISNKLKTKVIGVLTDYAPHRYWVHEGVDYYIVPCQETGQMLAEKGVPQHQIKPFGIPVDPKFTAPLDRDVIFRKMNFDPHVPVVLIMGGGQGLGPIKSVVRTLLSSTVNVQIIVVAGTNKRLGRWLQRKKRKSPKNMACYEFADNIEELMEIATLTITKPGGMTTAEALVKALPMVIIKPIPGQEMHNTEFLLKKNVAMRINQLDRISEEINSLLHHPERIEKMRQAARDNGKPQSSMDIARLIL